MALRTLPSLWNMLRTSWPRQHRLRYNWARQGCLIIFVDRIYFNCCFDRLILDCYSIECTNSRSPILFRWRRMIVMMVASLYSEVFRFHQFKYWPAAHSLGLKPKFWPAFLATQSSLLDMHSSNRVAIHRTRQRLDWKKRT